MRQNARSVCRQLVATGLFLLIGLATKADLIVLRSGHEYQGQLVEANPDQVVFEVGAEQRTFPRDQVVHVRLQKPRRWHQFERAEQIPDAPLQACLATPVEPARHPGAGTVTLLRQVEVVLDESPGLWTETRRDIVRILNEHGESASVRQATHRTDVETAAVLHGISIRPDGQLVHLRDTALQNESPQAQQPRYDRLNRIRFALPEGKPGVVLDAAIVKQRHQGLPLEEYYDEFLFGGSDPLADCQVSIWVPSGMTLAWEVLNDPQGTVAHHQEPTATGRWHRWRRLDAPQATPEPLMPPWSDVLPRLVVAASGGADWQQLALGLEEKLPAWLPPPAQIPPPPPATHPTGIWEAVSRQVADAGVSVAASGRVPGDLHESWRLRNGSAVDRAFLLLGWLRAEGLPARLAWIRPRSHGRLASQVPSLGAFSVPAVYLEGDQPQFWVPADQLARPEEAAGQFAGAPALVLGVGLINLPTTAPAELGIDREVSVDIDRHGHARVVDTITRRGSAARDFRAWRQLSDREIRREIETLLAQTVPRARDLDYELLGDRRLNAPSLAVRLRYRIPDFADNRRSLASATMPWLEFNPWSVGRDDRRLPLFWEQPRADSVRLSVRVPKNFQPVALPEAINQGSHLAELAVTSSTNADTSWCMVEYSRSALEGSPEDYPSFKASLEARAAVGRQYWVWQKR